MSNYYVFTYTVLMTASSMGKEEGREAAVKQKDAAVAIAILRPVYLVVVLVGAVVILLLLLMRMIIIMTSNSSTRLFDVVHKALLVL